MPQHKRYASQAIRQAAYRARCKQTRQTEQTAKGLPALPAIPAMPGWPRWNAAMSTASELLSCTISEMEQYYDDRSESWQEGERGEEHQDRIASVEAVLDSLNELVR